MSDVKTVRTSLGLRDVLFEEIDALRTGESNPARASAVSKLAVQIVNSTKLELDYQRLIKDDEKLVELKPIALGSAHD